MIVCLCNGHRDRDIRAKAAELGSTCPATIYTALAGPPRCGRCLDYARTMLDGQSSRPDAPRPETRPEAMHLHGDCHAVLA